MENHAGLGRTDAGRRPISDGQTDEASQERRGGHALVSVTVDGQPKQVPRGEYLVSRFKELVGVDPNRALDQVVEGEFKPLDDSAHIKVHGGEIFVSHVRTGSSS